MLKTRRIGAHLSTAKGLVNAAKEMLSKGGNALQVFSGSPQVWARKPIDSVDYQSFRLFCAEHDVAPVVTHAMYLINLATDKPENLQKSMQALKYDLEFTSRLGGMGVVVHTGSHQGRGFEECRTQVVEAINTILKESPKDVYLLLENAAQKAKIGGDLAELQTYIQDVSAAGYENQIGWCYDTCHGFAAGYSVDEAAACISDLGLWKSLKVIHINDSRDPLGSGRDRHENLGVGALGKEYIHAFLTHPQFSQYPLILETPGFDGQGPDAKNVEIVKELWK